MLHLTKNSLVTTTARAQVEIRQLEVDWYCGNYSAMMSQAAMLAGFAYGQLTTGMPEDRETPFWLEFLYLFLTCIVIGLELSAIILSTALSVWGPSLALRGQAGSADLHRAVDCLRDYQEHVFAYFMVGWILYFISAILQVWIFFERNIATVVTLPFAVCCLAILYYSITITANLRVSEREAVSGKIDAFRPYEHVGDLDHGLHSMDPAARERGHFCVLHTQQGPRGTTTASAGASGYQPGLVMPSFAVPTLSTGFGLGMGRNG